MSTAISHVFVNPVAEYSSFHYEDANDYEPRFTEALLFEIDPSGDKFEYKDQDITKLNCQYAWMVLSKIPKKETRAIDQEN